MAELVYERLGGRVRARNMLLYEINGIEIHPISEVNPQRYFGNGGVTTFVIQSSAMAGMD